MDLRLLIHFSNGAVVTLDPNWSEIYTGEKITLRCEIHRGDTEWEYEWRKSDSALSETESEIRITEANSDHTGDYSCRGKMKQSQDHPTNWSDKVTLTVTVEMLTLEPDFSHFYVGESVTFKCNIKGNKTNMDFKFTRNGKHLQSSKDHELNLRSLTADMSGEYQCVGHHRSPSNTPERSNTVTVTVAAHRPKAKISADRKKLPEGGSLTLSCSVDGSAGWTFWFTHTTTQSQFQEIATLNYTIIHSPGIYWCGASRGNPEYFTQDSDVFRIEMSCEWSVFILFIII
uniref:Ig-like domain-containing protein n=1 Tax=Sphaeramia orbicularis TaxID=375764 RepID=A0A673CGP3_9TELE